MTSLVWILFFTVVTLLMFILVPREKIAKLLPFGLIGGCAVALIIQLVAVPMMGLWGFRKGALLAFRGIPLGIVLAWGPATIIFGAYFEYTRSFTARLLYILAFAGIAAVINYGFLRSGYLHHYRWSTLADFLLGAAVHSVLSVYLARFFYPGLPEES